MKYTYSDEEDDIYSDATTSRRSTRNTGTNTPAEGLAGPIVTLSGRQVKSRQGGAYGESMLVGTHMSAIPVGGFDGTSEEPENDEVAGGRPRRAAASNHGLNGWAAKGGKHIEGYNDVDEMTSEDEDDASEQDYGDDEDEDDNVQLESDIEDPDDYTDDEEVDEGETQSLVVKLPVKTPTPEKNTTVKLRLTPNPESQPLPDGAVLSNVTELSLSDRARNGISTASVDNLATLKHASSIPSRATTSSIHVEAPAQPANNSSSSSPAPAPPSPMSPSLAFRGSPEKPQSVLPSINVGYGGS